MLLLVLLLVGRVLANVELDVLEELLVEHLKVVPELLGDGDVGTVVVVPELLDLLDLPGFAGHLDKLGLHLVCFGWCVYGVREAHSWTGVLDHRPWLVVHIVLVLLLVHRLVLRPMKG